jgi:triosephosphate isomerase
MQVHVLYEHLVQLVQHSGRIYHSENKLDVEQIGKSIVIANKIGLKTVVCVPNIEFTRQIMKYKPDFIAYEVPELIGTGKAISKERPESVKEFVEILEETEIIPLCGAGVSTGEDVRTAIELGTKGVIVASAVVKADNPREVLEDLAEGLR